MQADFRAYVFDERKSNNPNSYSEFSRMQNNILTCSNSSRTEYIGRYCLCWAKFFVFAKSLTASSFFKCCANFASSLKSISPCSPTTALSASIWKLNRTLKVRTQMRRQGRKKQKMPFIRIAKHKTCSAVFWTPRISPSFEPASSQNRCCDLFMLCFSRISLTKADPLRDIIAISDVGSFNGITGSACFVKTTLPSKNGGFVSVSKANKV